MNKQYEHLQAELEAQELWQKNQTYKKENNPGPLYSIDTPPPTISGSLHIGHIFSYTQTDIIARFKRMNGFGVFYPFGFDDNGLPTEKFVEKKHNIYAHDMKRSEFIDLCLKETAQVEKQFEKLWQRIGLSVDWSLCYSTIDNNSRKISQESFIELYKKDYIYRKNEPALYCTTCRTTVAQAELDDAEKPSTFNNIIFSSDGQKLVIGTTRPELLASCVALLYHPSDTRYQNLKGKTAITPIYGHEVPIIEDTDVDPQKGTGLVMCCTFGDKADIAWYKKYNLPYRQSVGQDGKWTENTGPLAGMRVATARETILKLLEAQGLLESKKAITHTVNIHERCKKEIEYLVLTQWFLKILPYKKEFLDLADNINWYPAFMKARYKNWVENVSWDWCLSRQRFYGIPFPVWHCTDCKAIIVADIKDLPIDPQEVSYKKKCDSCGSNKILPDTDVMDTWNTSSLTPYLCAALYNKSTDNIFDAEQVSKFIPMSMRPQAHDIIRTWAFYTIIKSWMHNGIKPWSNIVISGHVLSTEKEKISKSQGNAPLAPETLLEKYPADALRYWTASGNLGYDIAFSDNQIAIGQKLLVKLWNAFRFAEPYIQDIKIKEEPKTFSVVNQWLLHNISNCYKTYNSYFENNEFGLALDTVEKFFWHDFCDNYLELIKDQLLNPDKYNIEEVNSTKWTLYSVGLRILQLYSPFVPHITETIYGLLYKPAITTESVHQTRFSDFQKNYNFDESHKIMNKTIEIINQARKLKSEKQLSLKTDLEKLTIYSNSQTRIAIQSLETILKGITRSQIIEYQDLRESHARGVTPTIEQRDNLWFASVIVAD